MADKKRSKKDNHIGKRAIYSQHYETFDDTLERIMQETISSVVERETYPRGNVADDDLDEEDTHIYYTARDRYNKTGRYEQSPDTVAQHMVDRTQFRH